MKRPFSSLLTCALVLSASATPFARADAPTPPDITPTATTPDIHARETFAVIWERLQGSGFHGQHEGLDWDALKAAHQPAIEQAQDLASLRREIRKLLDDMKASHLELIPSEAFPKPGETPPPGDATLGLRLTIIGRNVVVEGVDAGFPAERAGIRPGWIVNRIDKFDFDTVFKKGVDGAPLQRRGLTMLQMEANAAVGSVAAGTRIALAMHDPRGRPRTIALTAARVAQAETVELPGLPPISLHYAQQRLPLSNGGCVLKLRFNLWALPVFDHVADALREHGDCAGVIIDLRDNPGGLVASVSAVAGLFFDRPTSLGTMTTGGGDLKLAVLPREVSNDGRDIRRFNGPLAILTDRASISCSDIFPASMQALGRARIFGDTSAGMALPAASTRLPSGDALLYPIAEFVDAGGRRIEGVGTHPDTLAPPTLAALRAGHDPAVDAAVAWIAGKPH